MMSLSAMKRLAGPAARCYLAMFALLCSVGSGRALAEFDHAALARQALEGHIRPLFADFEQKARDLNTGLEKACQKRDANGLEPVRLAYRNALLAWSRVEHLRFGPLTENNRFERIMFWPDRQKIGERQIQQIIEKRDPTALSVTDIKKKSAAVQGLTALETLLHGKSDAIFADTPDGTFACGFATAIAGNVSGLAKEIVDAWADGGSFQQLWSKPGENNPLYRTSSESSLELLKAYRGGVNNIRDIKLLPALGMKRLSPNGPFAPKTRPPFDLSGLGVMTVIGNMEGVLHLFEKAGFAEPLAIADQTNFELINSELTRGIATARIVDSAGTAAFTDAASTAKLTAIVRPLYLVYKLGGDALETTIAGKVLGFSDADGD